ncbi:MAG: phosphotransferase enzyme family protein, partial [Woeseiaceae bacterium]
MDKGAFESRYTTAALEALKHFPVAVENVKFVKHSENITFRVSVCNHESDYVLRLHRPGYNSLKELDSERIWLHALKEAGIPVPVSLLNREGDHFQLVDIPATGEQRYAGMTTWIQGTPLDEYLGTNPDPEMRKRIFRRIGELAAALHNQSSGWNEPAGFERSRLDVEGLLGDAPYWGRFWEHPDLTAAEKALLQRARERARRALVAYGSRPENFGLIHADLHAENIVYDGEELALIDFDDAAFGWHLYEIATALITDRLAPDFAVLRSALLEGYCEHRPLSKQDVDLLPVFMLIRGMAIIGW